MPGIGALVARAAAIGWPYLNSSIFNTKSLFERLKLINMRTKIIVLLSVVALLTSCRQDSSGQSTAAKKGSIKVTILYANGPDKTFNMDYYEQNHMPMVAELMGDAMNSWAIDKGIASNAPDQPVPYLAIGYLYFDSLSVYQEAFGPNAAQIVGDIPNYTNIQPVVQISEVYK